LEGFLGLYEPLERRLLNIDWADCGIDVGQRLKSQWLKLDLKRLGRSAEEISCLPNCRSLPPATSIPEGLGILYVLEGATLGGQIIGRRLEKELGIGAENGGMFFAAYGDRTGIIWRDFVSVLDRYTDDPAASVIESRAVSTFQSFEFWMSGGRGEVGGS
jgi:heme oxygenase